MIWKKLATRELILLIAIFAVALSFRMINLSEAPNSLHRDELISGYVGRFILLNHYDLYNNFFPIFYFDKYGDFPPVIPMYLSGISTFIFGISEFAIRFPIALLGALTVLLIYFLAREFFTNKKIALLSSAIIALMPWHIVLSRATAEGIVGLIVCILGVLYILKFTKNQTPLNLLSAFSLLFLTYFLYPSFRILVPLILLPIPLLFIRKKSKATFSILTATVVLLLITLIIGSTTWGKSRFLKTSVFTNFEESGIKGKLEKFHIDEGQNNIITARIFHNKIVGIGKEILNQYASYFSLKFLFLEGGLPYRYAVPDIGLQFIVFFPFFLYSFMSLYKGDNYPYKLYLLYLFFISPLPSPLTIDDVPNVHRAIFMIMPLSLLTACGLYHGVNLLTKKVPLFLVTSVLVSLLSIEMIYFIHQYFNHTAPFKSYLRSDKSKELAILVIQQQNNYEKILMPVHDSLPLYFLFYTKNFDKSFAGKFKSWLKIDHIQNIEFSDNNCPSRITKPKDMPENSLIIDMGDCEDSGQFTLVKTIYREDSTKAFKFYLSKDTRTPINW